LLPTPVFVANPYPGSALAHGPPTIDEMWKAWDADRRNTLALLQTTARHVHAIRAHTRKGVDRRYNLRVLRESVKRMIFAHVAAHFAAVRQAKLLSVGLRLGIERS
jgi:hypothetical protein